MENPDGSLTRLDNVNPDPTKKFTVASVDFLLRGPEGLGMLYKPKETVEYNFSDIEAAIEYVKSFNNKPFEMKPQNRIIVEKQAT